MYIHMRIRIHMHTRITYTYPPTYAYTYTCSYTYACTYTNMPVKQLVHFSKVNRIMYHFEAVYEGTVNLSSWPRLSELCGDQTHERHNLNLANVYEYLNLCLVTQEMKAGNLWSVAATRQKLPERM